MNKGFAKAYEHKFKSIFVIACVVGSFKTYGFYKTFRDILGGGSSSAPKKSLNEDKSGENASEQLSKRELASFLVKGNQSFGVL
jgi:hypothetical protein